MNTSCPYCDYHFDVATGLYDESLQPKSGDVSLCINCGEWIVFDGPVMRRPTMAEHIEIGFDPDCRKAREVWATVIENKRSVTDD